MISGNYHTHSRYDDGQGELEEYVTSALQKNFKYLGFSGHTPLPFETSWHIKAADLLSYKQTILELKQRYADQIEILLGLEVDYIPGVISPRHASIKTISLDYTIGSVHFLGVLSDGKAWVVDGPQQQLERGLEESFGGNVRALVEEFYRRTSEMLLRFTPDILGHFDLVKKNNQNNHFFSEDQDWYRRAVQGALIALQKSGAVMEVNTGGLARNTCTALYPSEWILAECLKLGIPLVLNSDAHTPEGLDALFPQTTQLLAEIGFRELRLLSKNGWQTVPITPA